MLRALDGVVFEVETEYLFKDQFNTAPLPVRQRERILQRIQRDHPGMQVQKIRAALSAGLRVMDYDVGRVIDDVRVGKQCCRYCGKVSQAGKPCPNSHWNAPNSQFLEIF